MKYWKITALYYGQLTLSRAAFSGTVQPELVTDYPFGGFLLQNGSENVLVDTGMRESYYEKMAIGDVNPIGSTEILLEALAKEGLTPADIDTVIYSHLHYDHCGNIDLFYDKPTYVQKKEYNNMMNPYSFQTARMDYFPDTPGMLAKVKNLIFVDGDIKLSNGLELYLTPGHSQGSQTIVVPTEKGRYVLTGDNPSAKYCLFPWLDKMTLMDGTTVDLTPITDGSLKFLTGVFVPDQFSSYDSYYKQLALAEKPIPEYFICNHEPENIFRKYFG